MQNMDARCAMILITEIGRKREALRKMLGW
jgi:hypothetical protein